MTELERTIGQMIDHLGLKASYSSIGRGFECDGGRIAMLQRGRMDVYWGDDAIQFTSLEDALRWMCERKDNDFQMHRWKVDEYRQLWVRIATSDGRSTFVKSAAATPWTGWKTPEGVPHPTDEQLDDLVRNDPILGLICWQMWGITPKEEA